MGLAFGMDAPGTVLKPIDRVLLNAYKKNTSPEFALEKGANLGIVDPENGYTGLHYACMNNNLDRVKWFLKKDWNLLNIISKNGADPINVAIEYGHLEIVRYLFDAQFIYLCKNFSGPYFQSTAISLLQRGSNVNAQADDILESYDVMRGFTPLLYACMDGEVEKTKFLLSKGADVNQKSAVGIFPLYVIFSSMVGGANESKRFELTKLLLEYGAHLNLTGPGHHGILAAAVASNSVRCVKLLLNKGIDVNVVDKSGHNALYEAISKDLGGLVPLLFDAGVKPISDIEGVSLVHAAAIKNNVPILKELIKRGLDVNLLDNDGQTPLHYAAEQAGVEVIKILLDAGALINVVDKNGKTPLMLAKTNPHKASLTYLQKESRKPVRAQKKIQVIDQPAPSQKKVTEKVTEEQPTKSPKKKKQNKKKKKKKEPVNLIQKDETNDEEDPWLRIAAESEAQTEKYKKILLDVQEENRQRIEAQEKVKQSEIAPIETEPAPVEQLAEQVQAPQLPKIKKPKKSLTQRVQEKVVDTFITPQTKKSFADVLAAQSNKPTEKTITDSNLKIAVPIDPQKQLMHAGYQENSLAKITTYSAHVEEKRNDPNDPFHNFSHKVEEELGYLAQPKVLKPATKRDSAKIEYTIPATVSFIGGKNVFPGTFEFIVQNEEMLHRAFIPNKKIDKKKIQLMLPAPTGDKGGTELPK